MQIMEIREKINDFIEETFRDQDQVKIIGMTKEAEEWDVTLEVIEDRDREYARKYAQKEVMSIYNIKLNSDLEIVSFERGGFRERGTA